MGDAATIAKPTAVPPGWKASSEAKPCWISCRRCGPAGENPTELRPLEQGLNDLASTPGAYGANGPWVSHIGFPTATAAFPSKTLARRMYPRSTSIDRWPVRFAIDRSEQSLRAAVVTNPSRSECSENRSPSSPARRGPFGQSSLEPPPSLTARATRSRSQ